MALDERHVGAVGFLFDEKQVGPDVALAPIGTFFVMQVRTGVDPAMSYPFLVTSQHVIQEHSRVVALMRGSDGQILDWKLGDRWFIPEEPTVDLAIHPLWAHPDGVPASAMLIEDSSEALAIMPKYGEAMYFVGLLRPVPTTWMNLVPVVRHGTLAAQAQPQVTWGTKKYPDKWGPSVVHLIDCRSWTGFSGSPCFMEGHWPGPSSKLPNNLPEEWGKRFSEVTGLSETDLGSNYYFHALAGIFVAYVEETSIGIVLPIAYLHRLIESEAVVGWMKDRDEELKQHKVKTEAVAIEQGIPADPGSDEYDRFEELTRRLVSVPKPEIDKERESD